MTTNSWQRRLRRPLGLAVGSVIGGLLAYVFFALVTRALGAVAAAPVSVLWVWWGFAGAALTFPLQHWITRTVTAYDGERALRLLGGRIILVVVGTAAAAGVVSWLARDLLFGRGDLAFPALVVAVTLGSGLLGVVRGTLSARGRLDAVGASIAAENALRCVAVAVLYAAGVDSPVAYGACLVVGYLAAAIWPSSLRFGRDGSPPDPGSPLALVGGVGLGQLLAQATLTGGPVLLAVAGGAPAEVTAIFAGLALFRAPYTLAVGLVAALTGRLTAQVMQGRWAALRRFRTMVVVAALVAAGAGAPLAAWIGPPLMSAVFGAGIRLPGDLTAVLAVGTVLAMANLVLTILVVARGRSAALVRGWLVGLVPGAAYFAWAGGDPLERTCWTFLVVEVAVFVWLVGEDVVSERRRSALAGGQEDR